MINRLRNLFYSRPEPKGIVLMYHRIAEPISDVWETTVSPRYFEEHLKMLKRMSTVVPLEHLIEVATNRRTTKNTIAITFDDGYQDNYTVAKPLLEKYALPATFFIASINIGTRNEFWWDELEQIILFSQRLPFSFNMIIEEDEVNQDLQEEQYLHDEIKQKHIRWKACTEEPPTQRAKLFYNLWLHLKPLHDSIQQQYLQEVRDWANVSKSERPDYRSLSTGELKQLAAGNLFTIGAHTVTHPALAYMSPKKQQQEIMENCAFLQDTTQSKVKLLSYPYGNYDDETLTIADNAGLHAAFTTEEKTIRPNSLKYRLGRYQVKNIPAVELRSNIKKWSA